METFASTLLAPIFGFTSRLSNPENSVNFPPKGLTNFKTLKINLL